MTLIVRNVYGSFILRLSKNSPRTHLNNTLGSTLTSAQTRTEQLAARSMGFSAGPDVGKTSNEVNRSPRFSSRRETRLLTVSSSDPLVLTTVVDLSGRMTRARVQLSAWSTPPAPVPIVSVVVSSSEEPTDSASPAAAAAACSCFGLSPSLWRSRDLDLK